MRLQDMASPCVITSDSASGSGEGESRSPPGEASPAEALRTIPVAQKAWADALGEEMGESKLMCARGVIEQIRRTVSAHGLSGD